MGKRAKKELFVAVFWSPFVGKVGYRGPAVAISSLNKVGKFDILPEHTNFISLIYKKMTIHLLGKQKIDYEFKRGVLEVSDNLIKVFLGL
jgi:F0F1-type ATP synthase epsilon subunit